MLTKRDFMKFIGALPVAFAAGTASAQTAPRKKAVATFSILGDFVKAVGGDRIELTVLVGPESDSHVYSPSAADARALKEADIIFQNGLGFEGWMERLIASSGSKAPVITVTEGVKTIEQAEEDDHGHDHGHGHGHNHGEDHAVDPHAWQNPDNVIIYVANIIKGLKKIDPEGGESYAARGSAYSKKLAALDKAIRAEIGKIPPEKRKIVTSHDAFGYFAHAYGLTFLAAQGLSSDSEASAKDIAALIRQIKKEKIAAVFVESISDPRLMQQIAKETGSKIGEKIYSDSLSPPEGPAATYLAMMQHNADAFVKALAP